MSLNFFPAWLLVLAQVNALAEARIRGVPRVTVHYIQMQPTVEVLLQVRAGPRRGPTCLEGRASHTWPVLLW